MVRKSKRKKIELHNPKMKMNKIISKKITLILKVKKPQLNFLKM